MQRKWDSADIWDEGKEGFFQIKRGSCLSRVPRSSFCFGFIVDCVRRRDHSRELEMKSDRLPLHSRERGIDNIESPHWKTTQQTTDFKWEIMIYGLGGGEGGEVNGNKFRPLWRRLCSSKWNKLTPYTVVRWFYYFFFYFVSSSDTFPLVLGLFYLLVTRIG